MSFSHIPVLLEEVCAALSWNKSIAIADFTVGGGGHLKTLLERFSPRPNRILANDQDMEAIQFSKKNLSEFEPMEWCHGSFRILQKENIGTFDRILVDLGVSSHQLDTAERGFSFQKDGPLDMRMDQTSGVPVSEYLERCDETELADILWKYGEERASRKLARRWCHQGQKQSIRTTKDFVEFFGFRLDSKDRNGRHPLTKVFQALRIHINQELEALEELLAHLPGLLNAGGRVAIITFHSLEDRTVKWGLRDKLSAVNKKVITASEEEAELNPRARSAKLRVYERGHDS